MAALRPLVAGNWKMNGLRRSKSELEKIIGQAGTATGADLMICPPAILLVEFAAVARSSGVAIGAQDCHAEPAGAFTGDISAEMIADAGASAIIVGHSERRTLHGETDAQVRAKAVATWRAGLIAIVCVGETADARKAGRANDVVGRQLAESLPENATPANLVVAYEPVWAIGTGLTPGTADIIEMHKFIRDKIAAGLGASAQTIRILYGGSVKPSNAGEILKLPNVNGALIGGASLKAEDFLGIAKVYG